MSGGINSADGLTEVESTGTGTVTSVSVTTANGFSGSVATATTTPAITLSMSSEGILAALAALDETAVFGGMATFTAVGAVPGEYTFAKSGLLVKNDNGDEVFRIWGTDPDPNNFNSHNLYIGWKAGLSQPNDNVDAGYFNVGIGDALQSITTGAENTAVGKTLNSVTTGNYLVAIGSLAGVGAISCEGSTALGAYSSFNDNDNATAIGYQAEATAPNRVVIGNSDVVDAYFGAEGANSNTHQNRAFVHGNTAPADGDLAAGQMAIWFDSSNGAAKFMVKAKQADGTVKTGSFDVQT